MKYNLLGGPQATTVYSFVKTSFAGTDEFGILMEY
jgi:hypothetical protein